MLSLRGGQRRSNLDCKVSGARLLRFARNDGISLRPRNQERLMPDLFETMSTMRAMRRLQPDPVPDELINKILQAGQWAPSGGNTQRWRFLVVKDPEVKKKVQVYYKRLFDE